MQQKRVEAKVNKKGSIAIAGIIVAVILALATSVYFVSDNGNSITGALVGIQTVVGSCNFTISSNIGNLGHDYECNESAFYFGGDDLSVDCQNHKIKCVAADCTNFSAFTINRRNNILLQNCFLEGWGKAIHIENGSRNNFTLNHFFNNTYNAYIENTSHPDGSEYNRIWNNNFTSYTYPGFDDGFNFWNLNATCPNGSNGDTTNIIGGPCLGGNFWDLYSGFDIDGDGLGDQPYAINASQGVNDDKPLIDPDGSCPLVWSVNVNLIEDFVSSTGECFALTASDIVLDCKGYSLFGNGTGAGDERGVEIVNVHNVTVQNCLISNFTYGIYVRNAQNITLINNTIRDNNGTGIYAGQSSELTFTNNTVQNLNSNQQVDGIWLKASYPYENAGTDSYLENNTVNNNTRYGIHLSDNSDRVTINNNLVDNNTNAGIMVNNSYAVILKYNEIRYNDRGVYFVDSDSGDDGTCALTSNDFRENYIHDNTQEGVLASNTDGYNFYYNNITTNSKEGISLTDSDNFAFKSNIINLNSLDGLKISTGTNIKFCDLNQVFNNTKHGINLSSVTHSTFGETFSGFSNSNSNIYNNQLSGFWITESSNLTIWFNNISTNVQNGIYFSGVNSSTIKTNNISSNSQNGTLISGGTGNIIYDNFFSGNTDHSYDDGTNSWNTSRVLQTDITLYNILDGPYLGGNFWDDYTGTDSDNDGLGDTVYSIPGGSNTDSYPLTVANISCGPVHHSFNLSSSLNTTGNCFTVTNNEDLIIDCLGYSIRGNDSDFGFNISGRTNVVIRNCLISNFSTGLYLNDANGSTFENNTFSANTEGINSTLSINNNFSSNTFGSNTYYGIYLSDSNSSTFDSNTIITNNSQAIYLTSSDSNNLSSNIIRNNDVGIAIFSSNSNTIYNNYFANTNNSGDDGTNNWNTSYDCTKGSNIVGGSCWGGNSWNNYNGVDDGSGTYPYNDSSDGIGDTLIPYNNSNNIQNGGDSLPLLSQCGTITNNIILTQNLTVSGTCFTITADNVQIDCNDYQIVGGGAGSGIYFSGRSGITIQNCHLENFANGVYAISSSGTIINATNITDTTEGIYFSQSTNSIVTNNYLYGNSRGIYFTSSSTGTNISANYIYSNSQWGAYFESSGSNTIYNNNFTNTNNAFSDASSSNDWNVSYNGSTSIIGSGAGGGNYWSNYIGSDSGLGANPYNISGDGIGDSNLPYNSNIVVNGDYFPLTASTGAVTSCPKTISQDSVLSSSITCSSGNGIIINADDITLDCNNYLITGDGTSSGIYITGRSNVVIKNCNITNFYYGVRVEHSTNIEINSSNYLYDNDFYAIYQFNSTGTKIIDNTLENDNNGVYSINSENTIIKDNNINLQKKFYGIYVFNSPNHFIENNTLWDNYHGIYLVNSSYSNSTNNNISNSDVYSLFVHKGTTNSIFTNNTIQTGSEALRVKNGSGSNQFVNNVVSNHLTYGLYSTNSDSNSYTSFSNNTNNVYLSNSVSNTFTNNTIDQSTTGLQALSDSNSLTLINNTINSTSSPSLEINDSTPLTISDNQIYNDALLYNVDSTVINLNNTINPLLSITSSDSLTISGNILESVYLDSTDQSVFTTNTLIELNASSFSSGTISSNTASHQSVTVLNLQGVTLTNITGNNIQNTSLAILLNDSSDNNDIYDNWLKTNSVGLNITDSIGNTIKNNYFENTINVFDDSDNTWNTDYSCTTPNIVSGPCKGGNFYSDYYGLDDGSSDREQGDGVGDLPSTYTISPSNVNDSYPLVLYVARQYYVPTTTDAASLVGYGNVSGELTDAEVVPNSLQLVNYTNTSTSKAYLEFVALFNQSNVNVATLQIDYSENKTAINKSGTTGINDYTIYLYHNNAFDAGVYICENEYNISENTNCSSQVNLTSIGVTDGKTLSQSDGYYKIAGITNTTMTAVLSKSSDACGGNILHDVTFTEDISCNISDAALHVFADNITINLAGYSLIGNSTGIGINVSNREGITILNANINNFSTGIYVDPSINFNVTNTNFTDNSLGLSYDDINDSFVVSNRFVNNTVGINLSNSYNNTVYDNYFNSTTNNAIDDGTNFWNVTLVSGTNMIGGNYLGGNFWDNYTGWDTDLDGIGDSIEYNITNSAGGVTGSDYLPLTEVGKIACGTVNKNISLNRDLNASGTCFTVASPNILVDCNNYTFIGDSSGSGILINSVDNITVNECNLTNFSIGINLSNSNYTSIDNNNIYNNTIGVYSLSSLNNTIINNNLLDNSEGINLSSSDNNSIYNNYFNNTNNSIDPGTNEWNTTYACSSTTINIVGGNCTGGNFWSNYNGSDNGTDTAPTNGTPWNISGDGVGDTLVPYNDSDSIIGGDYLPFVLSICGDGIKEAAEECDGTQFGGLACENYSASSGSLSCSSSCTIVSSACTNTTASSSSSSGGGGGGGGGSSSSGGSVVLSKKDNCTQAWECGIWNACSNGLQTRTCQDVNQCESKKDNWEVDNVITKLKPTEMKSCEVAVPTSESVIPPVEEEPSSAILPAIITEPTPVRTLALSSLALLAVFGGIFAYWQFAYGPNRLRRKLKKIVPLLDEESSEVIKGKYLGMYNLYLKLSESHKQNFYSKLTDLREKVEVQLKAEKKIGELIQQENKGNIEDQKERYLAMYQNYQKLPGKVQQKYYQHIVHLKEQLERGK
jgi:parallel beta-helix repeat protein